MRFLRGGGRNILDTSWVTLWKELETLESSFFYLQHLKLLKIQAMSQPSLRGDGGGKGKNRGSAAERGRGGVGEGETVVRRSIVFAVGREVTWQMPVTT